VLPAAFMTMGFVGGVGGLPYLKISDLGLVDIMGGKLVPLEVSPSQIGKRKCSS